MQVLTIIYSWENEIYFKYRVTGYDEVKGIDLYLRDNFWKDIYSMRGAGCILLPSLLIPEISIETVFI